MGLSWSMRVRVGDGAVAVGAGCAGRGDVFAGLGCE
jgi:hypothetical protein